jgi:hypothetical protein
MGEVSGKKNPLIVPVSASGERWSVAEYLIVQ